MSIANGLKWGYVEKWGSKAISLLVFLILARLLDPVDFGLVAFAKLFIDFLEIFVAQGLGLAILQKKNITSEHLSSAFWLLVVSSLLMASLIIVFSPYIAALFHENQLVDILKVLSILIVLIALSRIQAVILNREHKFRELSLRGLAMSIIGGVVGITLAINGFGVWSLIAQHICGTFAGLVVMWIATPWRPQFIFKFKAIKELYSYAFKVLLDQNLIFISSRIDEALIGAFLGTTALGYYSIAKRLFLTLIDMLYSSIGQVLVSVFSKIQDDINEISEKSIKTILILSSLCFPIFIFSSVMGYELIVLLFGMKWLSAGVPFSILVTSGIFLLTKTIAYPVFSALGKPELPLKLNIVRAIISTIFITVGAVYDLTGIVIAILITSIVTSYLDIKYLSIELGKNYLFFIIGQMKNILYVFPAFLMIILYKSFFNVDALALYDLIISATLFLVVYIITLFLFKSPVVFIVKSEKW